MQELHQQGHWHIRPPSPQRHDRHHPGAHQQDAPHLHGFGLGGVGGVWVGAWCEAAAVMQEQHLQLGAHPPPRQQQEQDRTEAPPPQFSQSGRRPGQRPVAAHRQRI